MAASPPAGPGSNHATLTLPGAYYTSDAIFAEEREAIFDRQWLCVGRSSQLRVPGDYVLQQLGPGSVIILRRQDGRLGAFHNSCRHRGTRLCEAPAGNVGERIVCPYHSWVYAHDGHLVGAPSTADIPGFDKSEYPLHAVAVEEWEGFIFICAAADPPPFAETFAPLIGRFSRFNLPRLIAARRIEYDVKANWKLLTVNYSECYHCSAVHPALVQITPATSGQNELSDGPILGGYMQMKDDKESMTMSGRACGVHVGDLPAEDLGRVHYYSIFPNMLLSLHPDYVMYHMLWPQSAGRTLITCEWLFHPDSLAEGQFDIDDGVRFWDMTNRQDWHICEESQLGVMSPAYRPGPYSPRESLPVAFERGVLAALGRERP